MGVILTFIKPSFGLLYGSICINEPAFTVHIQGHTWYWSYEYAMSVKEGSGRILPVSLCFDSYLVPEEELTLGGIRLLEVDKCLVLPVRCRIQLVITSYDVLHS